MRGTKAAQESKLVSLQQLIESYREDLKRPGTTERADQIERKIQKAEDQLTAVKDSIDALNEQLRSQVRQIRETISSVLDKNPWQSGYGSYSESKESRLHLSSRRLGWQSRPWCWLDRRGRWRACRSCRSDTAASGGQGWPQRVGKEALTSSRAYAGPTGQKGRIRTARPHQRHRIVAPKPRE